MMEEHRSNQPPNKPAKTGLTLAVLVGGFLLLIMILGWIYLAHGGGVPD